MRCITPSDDGKMLLSGSSDQTARIWNPENGDSKVEMRGHDHVIECCAFAPISAYAAIRELGGLGAVSIRVSMCGDDPDSMRLQASGRDTQPGVYAATGSRDKSIRIWDTASGQCVKVLTGHDNWVRGLVFAPNGKFLVSVSDDKTMKVWDLKTGRVTKTIDAHSHFVTSIAWGRARVDGGDTNGAVDGPAHINGNGAANSSEPKVVNVVATGSVDLNVKIWTP